MVFRVLFLLAISLVICQANDVLEQVLETQQEQAQQLRTLTHKVHRKQHAVNATVQNNTRVLNQLVETFRDREREFLEAVEEIQQKLKIHGSNVTTTGSCNLTKKVCPEGWRRFNESCYFFGVMPASRATAKHACAQMHAYLVEVNTYAEDLFLTLTLQEIDGEVFEGVDGFFTGGTDHASEGNWIWETSGQGMYYSNWKGNEGDAKYRNGEDYHVYWREDNYRWHDWHRVDSGGFICEQYLN